MQTTPRLLPTTHGAPTSSVKVKQGEQEQESGATSRDCGGGGSRWSDVDVSLDLSPPCSPVANAVPPPFFKRTRNRNNSKLRHLSFSPSAFFGELTLPFARRKTRVRTLQSVSICSPVPRLPLGNRTYAGAAHAQARGAPRVGAHVSRRDVGSCSLSPLLFIYLFFFPPSLRFLFWDAARCDQRLRFPHWCKIRRSRRFLHCDPWQRPNSKIPSVFWPFVMVWPVSKPTPRCAWILPHGATQLNQGKCGM